MTAPGSIPHVGKVTALIIAILIANSVLLTLVMLKLSELNGELLSLRTTASSINTKVDALLAGQGDPAIPAAAEETLVGLKADLAAIDAKLPAPTPPVV